MALDKEVIVIKYNEDYESKSTSDKAAWIGGQISEDTLSDKGITIGPNWSFSSNGAIPPTTDELIGGFGNGYALLSFPDNSVSVDVPAIPHFNCFVTNLTPNILYRFTVSIKATSLTGAEVNFFENVFFRMDPDATTGFAPWNNPFSGQASADTEDTVTLNVVVNGELTTLTVVGKDSKGKVPYNYRNNGIMKLGSGLKNDLTANGDFTDTYVYTKNDIDGLWDATADKIFLFVPNSDYDIETLTGQNFSQEIKDALASIQQYKYHANKSFQAGNVIPSRWVGVDNDGVDTLTTLPVQPEGAPSRKASKELLYMRRPDAGGLPVPKDIRSSIESSTALAEATLAVGSWVRALEYARYRDSAMFETGNMRILAEKLTEINEVGKEQTISLGGLGQDKDANLYWNLDITIPSITIPEGAQYVDIRNRSKYELNPKLATIFRRSQRANPFLDALQAMDVKYETWEEVTFFTKTGVKLGETIRLNASQQGRGSRIASQMVDPKLRQQVVDAFTAGGENFFGWSDADKLVKQQGGAGIMMHQPNIPTAQVETSFEDAKQVSANVADLFGRLGIPFVGRDATTGVSLETARIDVEVGSDGPSIAGYGGNIRWNYGHGDMDNVRLALKLGGINDSPIKTKEGNLEFQTGISDMEGSYMSYQIGVTEVDILGNSKAKEYSNVFEVVTPTMRIDLNQAKIYGDQGQTQIFGAGFEHKVREHLFWGFNTIYARPDSSLEAKPDAKFELLLDFSF